MAALSIVALDDDDAPIYAEPGELDMVAVAALARRSRRLRSDARKAKQATRERILQSQHRGDIETYLRSLYGREFARKAIKHITVALNPYADIVGKVVQLYRGGAIRRIDGVSADEQEAFDRLVAETGIDAIAQSMAEVGYGVGPQFVIPTVRRQRMRLLSPTPTCTDVVLDIEDPTGDAVAVSYATGGGQFVVVDGASHRTFDVGPSGVPVEVGTRISHGAGDMPAAALRFTPPREASDWWDQGIHARLEDGALGVGHVAAKLGLVRKAQHGHLLALTGNLDGMARGQAIGDPDGPIMARDETTSADDPRRTTIETLDFDTDPKNHLTHIRAIVEWMAESTGVPVTVATDGLALDYAWDHDALAEVRDQLFWWANMWERQLWTFAIHMARAQGHPLRSRLPTPDQVSAGFHLQLRPMHRKFSDPVQEQKHWDWLISRGCASVLDVARRFLGHRSDKALADQLKRNLEINAAWFDQVAKRNLPASLTSDGKIQTVAQAQGALGPAARDGQADGPGGSPVNNAGPGGQA